jgi:hypothetical protein
MQSESSVQNVLDLISFHFWAKSDMMAWWQMRGTLGLGPQSTSLVFHVCLALFFIQVHIPENYNEQTSWCSNNSSNIETILMIRDQFTFCLQVINVVISELVISSSPAHGTPGAKGAH